MVACCVPVAKTSLTLPSLAAIQAPSGLIARKGRGTAGIGQNRLEYRIIFQIHQAGGLPVGGNHDHAAIVQKPSRRRQVWLFKEARACAALHVPGLHLPGKDPSARTFHPG